MKQEDLEKKINKICDNVMTVMESLSVEDLEKAKELVDEYRTAYLKKSTKDMSSLIKFELAI